LTTEFSTKTNSDKLNKCNFKVEILSHKNEYLVRNPDTEEFKEKPISVKVNKEEGDLSTQFMVFKIREGEGKENYFAIRSLSIKDDIVTEDSELKSKSMQKFFKMEDSGVGGGKLYISNANGEYLSRIEEEGQVLVVASSEKAEGSEWKINVLNEKTDDALSTIANCKLQFKLKSASNDFIGFSESLFVITAEKSSASVVDVVPKNEGEYQLRVSDGDNAQFFAFNSEDSLLKPSTEPEAEGVVHLISRHESFIKISTSDEQKKYLTRDSNKKVGDELSYSEADEGQNHWILEDMSKEEEANKETQ